MPDRPAPPAPCAPPAPPARSRRPGKDFVWVLLALLFAASFLNFVDRQTLSFLKTTLEKAFAMDDAGYARVVNVFLACYAAAYVASGWVVDRAGPRRALGVFCTLWSLATIGCGLVQSVAGLCLMRGLLGLAEPGLQPVSIRVATAWAPPARRGLFMSLCGIGGSVGTVAAPPLIYWLAEVFGWRASFLWPGVVGLVIVALWLRLYRDPEEPPSSTGGDAVGAPPLPWGALWKTKALWGVVLCRLVTDPVWYFCLFWLPDYLEKSKGFARAQIAGAGWIPFIAASAGGIAASALSDRVAVRDRVDRLRGRKRLLAALSAAGVLCALVPRLSSAPAIIVLFCAVTVICACWFSMLAPIIAEVFPLGNIASVYGIAGTVGATGAIVFTHLRGQIVDPLVIERLFYAMAFLHPLAAVILFTLVRRPKQLQA
ncbi:MAG: MFS transporter [Opitutaceae bacterium]|nr:MFS transporter [Opitutaceae bacterium]